VVRGLDWFGSLQGQVTGTCERGAEPSGSIKCGEYFDYLRSHWRFKNDHTVPNGVTW